jgi:hypothetical protein
LPPPPLTMRPIYNFCKPNCWIIIR